MGKRTMIWKWWMFRCGKHRSISLQEGNGTIYVNNGTIYVNNGILWDLMAFYGMFMGF